MILVVSGVYRMNLYSCSCATWLTNRYRRSTKYSCRLLDFGAIKIQGLAYHNYFQLLTTRNPRQF